MLVDLTLSVGESLVDEFLRGQEDRIIGQGHVGTHLDTYNKSEIPLDYFRTKGLVVDVRKIAEKREILISDIPSQNIGRGSFIIFRTGRVENHPYGCPEYFKDHPILSYDLIDYLLERKVSFIGIDCAGIRRGEEHRNADVLCEKNGVYVIENLSNLDRLEKDQFKAYTMWLDDPRATGLRCRVLAEY